MKLAIALAAVALATAVPAGAHQGSTRPVVLAAASLTDVFPKIDQRPRYSFEGSDQLAAQIEQGAPADVYAAASPKYPEQLHREGLLEKPIPFTSNRLVVVVPRANPARVRTVFDLTHDGIKVVVGDASVPIGAYTRQVLARLKISKAVLGNVVSEEPDVRSILAKVALGEADAGFVYVTDAKTVPGKVRSIAIPRRGEPVVRYELGIVKRSAHRRAASAFVREVLSRRGQRLLRRAGFGPRR